MTKFVLREATINDAKIIFDLSNQEDVRLNSINKKPIMWENHLNWLKLKLDDKNYKIILFFTENDLIGQVKFEIKSSIAIISISLHRDFRGQGLSPIILKTAIKYLFEKDNIVSNIIALIRPENQVSIKSFSKVGFIFEDNEKIKDEMFLKYKLNR